MTLALGFDARLPDWLAQELATLPAVLATDEERAGLVNRLSDQNWRAGNGGPFAAIVVERGTGRLVSVGVNIVLSSGKSSFHAEVTALTLAQEALGGWDLSGADLELVVNWRMCAMCYGSVIWSGVRSVLLAGTGPECEALTGFDEGPMVEDWIEQLAERGIELRQGVRRDEAIEVFRAYGASGIRPYNADR